MRTDVGMSDMTANTPATELCPRCGFTAIEPVDAADSDDDADVLSSDVTTPVAERPNMHCTNCDHRWWLAPHTPDVRGDIEGVAD
jgi:hypothetical protein